MRRLTPAENEILRFAEIHGQYTVVGIVQVLAARKLAFEGKLTMVSDDANEDGIGSATVQHKEVEAA